MERRRFIFTGTAVALAGITGALPAAALSTRSAQALVEAAAREITATINSGRSQAAVIREFERIFSRYADVPNIARYTLGVEARSASAAELRAYTAAFQGYMARKYGRQFQDFQGGEIQVTGARTVNNIVEVRALASAPGSNSVEVLFLVRDSNGQDRMFNIFVEGINMLLSERDEILAMLDARRGDIGRLTRDLQAAG